MVDHQALQVQNASDSQASVVPTMLDEKQLNLVPQFHFFLIRFDGLPMPVKARPANIRQPAESLDIPFALQLHHFHDLVVDAGATTADLDCRRTSIFCKAPLKKSRSK